MQISHGRNTALDGLRGYAAVAVVFFHAIVGLDPELIGRTLRRGPFSLDSAYDGYAKIMLTLFNGQTAVVIFFILSGIVLFDSLRRETETGLRLVWKFLLRRFFRIYPALFVCILCCWAAFAVFIVPLSPETVVKNLLLYEFGVNGATWTLNVEAFGSLFLVVAFLAYQRWREPGIIVLAALLGCVYLAPFNGYLLNFRMFIYSFALGMLIPTELGRRVIHWLPQQSWPVLLIVMLFSRSTIQETIAALFVGMIYYRRVGALGTFLSRPISVFLGTISYSLYLFNVLFLEIVNHWMLKLAWVPARAVEIGLLDGLLITLVTIPVAYGSYRYIELPFIRVGQVLTSGRPSRAPEPRLS